MTDTPTPGFDLERMRDAAKNATPGRWTISSHVAELGSDRYLTVVSPSRWIGHVMEAVPNSEEDAAHIAASNPASVLALISAYETLREEIEDMRASLDKISAEIYSTRAAYEAEKERADKVTMDALTVEQDTADAYIGVIKSLELNLFDANKRADENFKDAETYSDAAKMWRDECELARGHVSHLRAQLATITDQHAAHGWRTADDVAMRAERDALAELLRRAVTKA